MARHRPVFDLIEESALVNPIKKAKGQRYGRAFVGWPPLRSHLPDLEPRRDSLSVKGQRGRAIVDWAPNTIHLVHPLPRCPIRRMP